MSLDAKACSTFWTMTTSSAYSTNFKLCAWNPVPGTKIGLHWYRTVEEQKRNRRPLSNYATSLQGPEDRRTRPQAWLLVPSTHTTYSTYRASRYVGRPNKYVLNQRPNIPPTPAAELRLRHALQLTLLRVRITSAPLIECSKACGDVMKKQCGIRVSAQPSIVV